MSKFSRLAFLAASLFTVDANAADLFAADDDVLVINSSSTDWSGFYAGIFGGVAPGRYEYNGTAGFGFPYIGDDVGGLVGMQAGANYQMGNFVFGGVVDLALTSLEGSTSSGPAANDITISSSLKDLGSVRGKVGFAMSDVLAYVHGGLAFGQTRTSAVTTATGVPFDGFHGNDRIGFTIGAGVEVKVLENVSLFAEYAYTDLGTATVFTNPPGFAAFDLNETLRLQTVKAGANFHF
ncbi:MAG: porin family protein [Devosia sp.]|nr:porin family protein [Devosia sp.]